MFDPTEYLDHLRTELDRIMATSEEVLNAPVTACPGWSVADLLAHHDGVMRFATAQLRADPGADMAKFDPPEDGIPVLESFSSAADALCAELVAVDPTEHRPNWIGAPESRFWWRRMAHEAAIHRWDVEAAYTPPAPIDTGLALDGVEEFCDVFLAHAARRGITGTGESLHLHATDDDIPDGAGEWMFTFTPDGVDVEHAHGKGDMAVRGPAHDLVLFVWNRRPVEVQTFGDIDPLAWWSAKVTI
ncbi:MAG: maleylpyruvate isomerase family mycothiol-dependent enzyme [Acidimicrobiales bacterium]|nr:maleylpyruvate isomerase family mycothiol-dependent enzyme [Acidimicrobiales bacterium]